jgi:hypothetical protein
MAKTSKHTTSHPEVVADKATTISTDDQRFCYYDGDTLVLNILGTPSAKRDVIGKPKGNQLKISVTKEPENGKATDHMVKFLAREFGVKTNQITVVYGQMNVNKQLRIQQPKKLPPVIAEHLAQYSV